MTRVLIFAGTTEGRELSEFLSESGMACDVCVATSYGTQLIQASTNLWVHEGRMDEDQMLDFMKREDYIAVVDATHPYATEASDHIEGACQKAGLKYLRLQRDITDPSLYQEGVQYFASHEECAAMLMEKEGNILLTTGSKNLSMYCETESLRDRLLVRVIPSKESLELCEKQGLSGKQILAMQGPFSTELNVALIRQYQVRYLVTKLGGVTGGYDHKKNAALETGVTLCVIGSPVQKPGFSFGQVVHTLNMITGVNLKPTITLNLSLIGIGMGSIDTLTIEGKEHIDRALVLFGAKRMIAPYTLSKETYPFYTADQILPQIQNILEEYDTGELNIAVLFSGDSGFYSGGEKMYEKIQQWKETQQRVHVKITMIPGISSISYLAAKCNVSWQDGTIISTHGKGEDDQWLYQAASQIQASSKTFVIMSHVTDLQKLCQIMMQQEHNEISVYVGRDFSYPEEQINHLTLEEAQTLKTDGLYTCLFRNQTPRKLPLTHGEHDGWFIRGKVPMTKEEIRDVVICKLHLTREGIVYDVGCGTGSVAVEIARLSWNLKVYGIEQKHDGVDLIRQNAQKAGIFNLQVVCGKAPEALRDLPAPTHVFIGGSSGKLKEILEQIYVKNHRARVVITAITMETVSELSTIEREFPVSDWELVQVQVARSCKIGSYHLMEGENPVSICSFTFREDQQ